MYMKDDVYDVNIQFRYYILYGCVVTIHVKHYLISNWGGPWTMSTRARDFTPKHYLEHQNRPDTRPEPIKKSSFPKLFLT